MSFQGSFAYAWMPLSFEAQDTALLVLRRVRDWIGVEVGEKVEIAGGT
jgi:hypothetical protein